jgi:hypothetical protein
VAAAGRFVARHSEGIQKDCEACIEGRQLLTGLGMNGSQHSDGRLESECVGGYVTLMMQQYCVMRLTLGRVEVIMAMLKREFCTVTGVF